MKTVADSTPSAVENPDGGCEKTPSNQPPTGLIAAVGVV